MAAARRGTRQKLRNLKVVQFHGRSSTMRRHSFTLKVYLYELSETTDGRERLICSEIP